MFERVQILSHKNFMNPLAYRHLKVPKRSIQLRMEEFELRDRFPGNYNGMSPSNGYEIS